MTPEAAKKILRNISKGLKLGGKKVFMPLRIALTGSSHGPELNELIAILGKERVVSRIKRAWPWPVLPNRMEPEPSGYREHRIKE